jgi:hypothetical protein
MYIKFWLENLKGRNHLEDLGTNGRIMEQILKEIWWRGVDRVYLAQDRKTVMNIVMKLQNPQRAGNFLTS